MLSRTKVERGLKCTLSVRVDEFASMKYLFSLSLYPAEVPPRESPRNRPEPPDVRSLRGKIRVVKIRAAHCQFVGISLGEAVDRSAAGLNHVHRRFMAMHTGGTCHGQKKRELCS